MQTVPPASFTAQGLPWPGAPRLPRLFGSGLVRLIRTTRFPNGVPSAGHATQERAAESEKQGSLIALPMKQRQASRRGSASEPEKHEPLAVLATAVRPGASFPFANAR